MYSKLYNFNKIKCKEYCTGVQKRLHLHHKVKQ